MASGAEGGDVRDYVVVVNDEEQYSIWLADREIPHGWRDAGRRGAKAECLKYISEVWTDVRPLSVRKWLDAQSANGTGHAAGKE